MKYTKVKDNICSYEVGTGKKYRVRLYYKRSDGTRDEVSKSGFKTIAEAEAYCLYIESTIAQKESDFLTSKYKTFRDHWERYKNMRINNRSWNKLSIDNANVKIAPWLDRFGDQSFDNISREAVQKYIHELFEKRNYSEETMKSYFGMFMQVVNDTYDEGIILRNPYRKVSWKRLDDWQPKRKVINLVDYKTFMRLARQYMRPDVYRYLYLLTFGLRRGEAYGIKAEDIQKIDGVTTLSINTSRTRRYLDDKGV